MGGSASAIAPEDTPSFGSSTAKKRMSVFTKKSNDLTEWTGSNALAEAAPLTDDVVEFLLEIFDGLFCLEKGFERPLQTSLLLDVVQYASFEEGCVLMKQGDIGHELFIIENGDVEVLVNGETVCHFRRGDVVGELSMLYDAPRSATIRCLSRCTCFVLSRTSFKNIQEITASNNIARRTEWLQGVPEFAALGNVGIYKIVQALQLIEMKEGEKIYEKNVPSNRICIVESGLAEIQGSGHGTDVDAVSDIDNFAVRTVSVKADEETREMVDEKFPQLKAKCQFSQKFCSFAGTDVQPFFEQPPTSSDANGTPSRKEVVSPKEGGNKEAWSPADTIKRDLSSEPSFCDDVVYRCGSVMGISVLSANSKNKHSKGSAPSDPTSEWAWVNKSSQSSQSSGGGAVPPIDVVVTSATATVLCVSLDTLEDIFGSMADVWVELQACVREKRQYVLRKSDDDAEAIESNLRKQQHFDISKFEQLCFIKDGTYGCSTLTRYVDDENKALNKVYCLVRKSKSSLQESNMVQHAFEEVRILSQLNSPFVARLCGISTTPHELVFVFDNMGVFDLWSFLYEYSSPEVGVDGEQVKCLLASIVHGLDHMHSRGITYKELKPENISIDNVGRVRLSEFGAARRIPYSKVLSNGQIKIQMKSFTLTGTPEYLAPEIVLNYGMDHTADVWAFGIIAYEMLMFTTPFADDDGTKVFSKIASVMKKGFTSPPKFVKKSGNTHIREMVEQILRGQPSQRLSCSDRKTSRILRHSFFKGFDCEKVKQDDYCLPGYSDLNHQNSMVTSVSYKAYAPEVMPFTGDKSIWKAFDEL